MQQSKRGFVEKVDFITSLGHGKTGKEREELGIKTKGPSKLITDLCVMETHPESKEFIVTSIHPGVTREQIQDNTGWTLTYADNVIETAAPTERELSVLRDLNERTARTHASD
jgi:glutaconate CoA-transferase subunit B